VAISTSRHTPGTKSKISIAVLVEAPKGRPGADDQAVASCRQYHAAHPGYGTECDGHHDSTRLQLGPDAGAPAARSDLRCGLVRRRGQG
jgi:hypothetical protein